MIIQVGLSRVTPGSVIGELIDRMSGGGGYCHAFLSLPDLWGVYESHMGAGVRFVARYIGANETLVDIPDLDDEKALNILRACVRYDGRPYDSQGVFHFAAPIVKENPNAFFCSEAVVKVMQSAGYFMGINPATVTPNGLAKLMNVTPTPTTTMQL